MIDEMSDDVTGLTADDDLTGVVEAAGHFRIYLGAAAGVGKTFAMLNEGNRRHGRGTDVVIGFVETHGRPHTTELTVGLEAVPLVTIEYRRSTFEELNLEAVLERHPEVVLIDELAHTNIPGSGPHAKRWEDVLQILEAGIDVITTVNIQHLESIADAVERMTGSQVRERVPDWVVRKADQIELVDSSPEQLRRRMLHGNIYPKEKVPQALANFFREDNLIGLRELALRFLADETEEELLEHLRRRQDQTLWETTERIMVGVTNAPGFDLIVRRAARMSARSKGELHVVHVVRGDAVVRSGENPIENARRVALDVGAQWVELQGDDVAATLMDFARRTQITQIVLGASRRSRWREFWSGGSIVWKVQRLAASENVDVHIIARLALQPEPGDASDRAASRVKGEAGTD
jgi:two-component system, OmpR family, sensor histidine kinase KdpD